MNDDATGILERLQSGAVVAVAGRLPDKLLGVGDGFSRYFRTAWKRTLSFEVVARNAAGGGQLPLHDDAIRTLAHERAWSIRDDMPAAAFVVGSEAGLVPFEVGGTERWAIRTWNVILASGAEAWGSSASLELPPGLIEGLDPSERPTAVPGTRRHGGAVATVTRGLESRRTATATATEHALATLLYTAR